MDSYHIHVPRRTPSVNTLWHDATAPSSVQLPMVPLAEVDGLGDVDVPCGTQQQVRCVTSPEA